MMHWRQDPTFIQQACYVRRRSLPGHKINYRLVHLSSTAETHCGRVSCTDGLMQASGIKNTHSRKRNYAIKQIVCIFCDSS